MAWAIRRAVAADAVVIADFNRLMALETEGKALDPAVLAAGVAAVLADPYKGLYFLAEEGGRVLGQAMVTPEWSDWRNGWIWWFQSVYVRPEARRRGVFRGLYEHVYRTASADPNVIGLRLYVEKENHLAQQTYLGLGMTWAPYLVLEKFPL